MQSLLRRERRKKKHPLRMFVCRLVDNYKGLTIYPFSCHFIKNGSWVITTSTVDWPQIEVERWTQELRMHKLGH